MDIADKVAGVPHLAGWECPSIVRIVLFDFPKYALLHYASKADACIHQSTRSQHERRILKVHLSDSQVHYSHGTSISFLVVPVLHKGATQCSLLAHRLTWQLSAARITLQQSIYSQISGHTQCRTSEFVTQLLTWCDLHPTAHMPIFPCRMVSCPCTWQDTRTSYNC